MKLVLSTTVEGIQTRQDGTLKVVLATQEIDPSQGATLLGMRNKFIKVLLSDTNITEMEEKIINEEIIQDGRKVKTQSQRLRAVIYRIWETTTQTQDFDAYYKSEMERIIEHFKTKLD